MRIFTIISFSFDSADDFGALMTQCDPAREAATTNNSNIDAVDVKEEMASGSEDNEVSDYGDERMDGDVSANDEREVICQIRFFVACAHTCVYLIVLHLCFIYALF